MRAVRIAALAFVLAACANAAPASPLIEASALPTPAPAVSLDLAVATATVSDPVAHIAALQAAGFVGGTARTWTPGLHADVRFAVVRALRFDSVDGAAEYLAWLTEHPSELIGSADRQRGSADPVVFVHAPSDCCPKDLASVLAVAARGDIVWSALVTGPRAGASDALDLLTAVA